MLQRNKSLKAYNTFGIDSTASHYSSFDSISNLKELLMSRHNMPLFILGGGSNILFTKNFNGLVLKNEILGFEILEEDDEAVLIKVGAGINWHEFVLKCIALDFGGVENLSLIPGNVGASPMQNIGAYGVEIKDVFEFLDAVHISSGEIQRFSNQDCDFGYRESIFKNKVKGEYVICHVGFRLSKRHKLNTSYGAIEVELNKRNISNPNIKDVSNAVISIRQSKLPDPKVIGNAGSFFKNPIITVNKLKQLLESHPDIPNYPSGESEAKLAAGWLIEQSGWKGKVYDERYGVHKKQALVLVNYNNATGNEILNLSLNIIKDVEQKFGVRLEREVNIL
jgi:UDP-N-acetylmuramate dehydrogenase|tara:strand:+ start:14362 stop:15372 length:1011 start_codon:yes stop_codon:yes gene_type:complete